MHNKIEMIGQLTNQSGVRISTRLKIENKKKKRENLQTMKGPQSTQYNE